LFNLILDKMYKYSKERAMAQVSADSLKATILEPGTTLKMVDMVENTFKQGTKEVPADYMLMETSAGRTLRLPVRELFKMKSENGPIMSTENGADEVGIPTGLKVVASEDRLDRDGDKIYPIFAYNKGQEMLDSGEIDWTALKKGGLKAGTFAPVQNYTVEIL
jgi:hypothetical protein